MAQLNDSVVNGNLRVTGDALPDTLQTNKIKVPTSSGGSTYGVGSAGQMLTSNGTTAYWSTPTTGTVTSVKVGTTAYNPSSGVVSLPAYPDVPVKAVQLNGSTITPSANGTVNVSTGIGNDDYGPSTQNRILARGNVFVPVWTENPEQTVSPTNYFYNGIVPMRLVTPGELIGDIPTGVTWSNFAYFRIMNMSTITATVTWTSDIHATSLTLGTLKESHGEGRSNFQYTDWPIKSVVTLGQRDNGSGASRDMARITISDVDGTIKMAANGSTATAYANFARVQFSISYVNKSTYGPNDSRWYNEAPS